MPADSSPWNNNTGGQLTTKTQSTIESGLERIEEIKKSICACKSTQTCKAEVYEMWDGIFENKEEDQ